MTLLSPTAAQASKTHPVLVIGKDVGHDSFAAALIQDDIAIGRAAGRWARSRLRDGGNTVVVVEHDPVMIGAADRLISARAKRDTDAPSFDATDGLQQLAGAREAFRREPTAAGLTRIQSLCGAIVGAMQSQPVLAEQTRRINCDPGAASESAAA